MKLKGPILSTAVAVLAGLTVLVLGLFPSGLEDVYARLLQAATALAAVALVAGLINLLRVHSKKISEGNTGSFYSSVLIAAFAVTFLSALVLGPSGSLGGIRPTDWLFRYIQVPVETTLVALLAVSLIYAAARLLRRRPDTFSIVFLVTALLVLLGGSLAATSSFGLAGDLLAGLRNWIRDVPAAGGARGILIGVALGAVAAGLRILIGTDRPYSG